MGLLSKRRCAIIFTILVAHSLLALYLLYGETLTPIRQPRQGQATSTAPPLPPMVPHPPSSIDLLKAMTESNLIGAQDQSVHNRYNSIQTTASNPTPVSPSVVVAPVLSPPPLAPPFPLSSSSPTMHHSPDSFPMRSLVSTGAPHGSMQAYEPFEIEVVAIRFHTRQFPDTPIYSNVLEYLVEPTQIQTPVQNESNNKNLPRQTLDRRFAQKKAGLGADQQKQLQQNLDVLAVFRHMIDVQCFGLKFFLWMEDDFTLCPSAHMDIYYIRKWALEHWDHWAAIRMGFGLSGIVMKCDRLAEMTDWIQEHVNEPGIDWMVSHFYEAVGKREHPQVMRTYRWNLFEHKGGSSTLWDTTHARIVSGCRSYLLGSYMSEADDFNIKTCNHAMFSPCESDAIEAFDPFHYADPPLTSELKALRQWVPGSQNNALSILTGRNGQTCTQVCSQAGGKRCLPELFAFINQCQIMNSVFDCRCMFGSTQAPEQPMFHKGACYLSGDVSHTTCDGKWSQSQRICPCGG